MYFDIMAARDHYANGGNVTKFLRDSRGLAHNTPDIIEISYDLQSGTYIRFTLDNIAFARAYAKELAEILTLHVNPTDRILDIGTGEMTTLSLMLAGMDVCPREIMCFDISWSRIKKGLGFALEKMPQICFDRLNAFVADISAIPLPDKSVDIVISSHALEPNGGQLELLMMELFRIVRRKLVLFEPCYERNSEEGQHRMAQLGYIRSVEKTVGELGGEIDSLIRIENTSNQLNPTYAFVITPAGVQAFSANGTCGYSVPGTNLALELVDGFYHSKSSGLCFPVLQKIPILRRSAAILASALVE